MADALADDFADAGTRLDFKRCDLVFADAAAVFEGAAARLETLAPLAPLAAAFFAGLTGLAILAEILASLLLGDELDLDDRLITFDARLDDFFVVFFPVDMTGLLLKLNASGVT